MNQLLGLGARASKEKYVFKKVFVTLEGFLDFSTKLSKSENYYTNNKKLIILFLI